MLAELDRHPHARAVLGPALDAGGESSHAYLFHGPGGSGKRAAARAVAAELLTGGELDLHGARDRVLSGAHPDLTWVTPSGAHEMLVSDIDQPVVAAASRTPFESTCRVFVIERVDQLGDEAANRMLKTLEEPASFVHLILLSDRLVDVLPTIRSRCQLVRFDAPPAGEVAGRLADAGVPSEQATACARLALGDAQLAAELASGEGATIRDAAEGFATAVLAREAASRRPWEPLLGAVKARGELARAELEGRASADIELYPRKEQKRIEGEWGDRIRRSRRRAETAALDLGLQLVSLWFADLTHLGWQAPDLVRNVDRVAVLEEQVASGGSQARLGRAIELVEETRRRFSLNVSEDLACEALAYHLEHALDG